MRIRISYSGDGNSHAGSAARLSTDTIAISAAWPVRLFDSVSTAADLAAVMELVGWTNDRLVAEHIDRLPRNEWVYGRANASAVMAACLHVAPAGMRFNGADLGAWYAEAELATAAAEVGHHLGRESVTGRLKEARRTFAGVVAGGNRSIPAVRPFPPFARWRPRLRTATPRPIRSSSGPRRTVRSRPTRPASDACAGRCAAAC